MCLTDLFWWRQSWGQWPQLLQVFVGFFSQLVGVVLELLATEEHKNCYDLTLYWWHTLPEILITRPVLTACLGALRFPVSYPVGRGYFLSDQLQRKETIWVQHAAPGFMMCVQECECVREREMAGHKTYSFGWSSGCWSCRSGWGCWSPMAGTSCCHLSYWTSWL